LTPTEIEAKAKENGHPPSAEGVVCVDFDGTIAPWGDLFGYPKPLPGAVKFLRWLKDNGYTVYIFTSRLSAFWHQSEGRDPGRAIFEQVEYLQNYCKKYGIEVDGATAEKVPAMAYIDDKAVEYIDWKQASKRFKVKTGGQQ
jgi:hypothetical protein